MMSKQARTFRDSFVATVHLKPEESCSLKRHYRNCAREAIGWLDHKAKLDPERFVAFTVPALTKACNRYDRETNGKGERYKQSMVEKVLALFRDERAISGPVERVRNGRARIGVIVAPHDARFAGHPKQKAICCTHPSGKTPSMLGRWESSGPGGTVWWVGSSTGDSGLKGSK
jgi:hypothetical protein